MLSPGQHDAMRQACCAGDGRLLETAGWRMQWPAMIGRTRATQRKVSTDLLARGLQSRLGMMRQTQLPEPQEGIYEQRALLLAATLLFLVAMVLSLSPPG
jgi:hypothetical protein